MYKDVIYNNNREGGMETIQEQIFYTIGIKSLLIQTVVNWDINGDPQGNHQENK